MLYMNETSNRIWHDTLRVTGFSLIFALGLGGIAEAKSVRRTPAKTTVAKKVGSHAVSTLAPRPKVFALHPKTKAVDGSGNSIQSTDLESTNYCVRARISQSAVTIVPRSPEPCGQTATVPAEGPTAVPAAESGK